MCICLYTINYEDTHIVSACHYQILISTSMLIYAILLASSSYLQSSELFYFSFYIYVTWLRVMYVIRYFQIPGNASDEYYKTILYLRIQMILEMLELVVFVLLLGLITLIISVGCCQAFCPNVIEAHSILITLSCLLSGEASSVAIKFVTDNLPKTEYNPDIHTSEKECIICMEEFVRDAEITELPCDRRHFFHTSCVMDWVTKAKKVSCPICRKDTAEELIKKQKKQELENIAVDA
eukprot:TRINITY_DN6782_c0_g1_i13.p1 TRINITY_DN6782_c0_g1~~TRINITY_DN6782_c0_g1_i13.p1  ORF type:complete len:237 (-),score=21.03 TRINITY_DN6782_c0_g1_i13:112-822(-)